MLNNRYEFLLSFDVTNGNPNGDPSMDNAPRMDLETNIGEVTAVSIKRKVRDYVAQRFSFEPDVHNMDIYVKSGVYLNDLHQEAFVKTKTVSNGKKGSQPKNRDQLETLQKYMCEKYYDVRTFGAVMSTEVNCGTIRGCVQLDMANSVDEIFPVTDVISRCAVNKKKTPKGGISSEESGTDESSSALDTDHNLGNMKRIPYGLYVVHGYINAFDSRKNGFSEDDLNVLWEALSMMMETSRSASRGSMATKKLIVFKHDSPLGNVHSDKLFNLVHIKRKSGIRVPRRFEDYDFTIDYDKCPKSVEIIDKSKDWI